MKIFSLTATGNSIYIGTTGRSNWVGFLGECELELFILDRNIAAKLGRFQRIKQVENFNNN